jgi:hypothetical protein
MKAQGALQHQLSQYLVGRVVGAALQYPQLFITEFRHGMLQV